MNDYTNYSMEKTIVRHASAKQMVMNYPHYTDDHRNAWLDAIDGHLDVILQAHKNAHDAMEEAFRTYKKD
jgi:hypothetical protein